MNVTDSAILFTSTHASIERDTVRESLRVWSGGPRPAAAPAAIVTLSGGTAATDETQQVQDTAAETAGDPRMLLIMLMVEALTGKKIKILHADDLRPGVKSPQWRDAVQQATAQNAPRGWGVEYQRSETHYEAELASFSAEGVVRTADGREIRFSLQLTMQREFQSSDSESFRAGDAARKDPLVINFSGDAAQLTDTRFAFDIDSDGNADSIPLLGAGSGFLALDKNGNGKIDNGGELFGSQSGNGFAELAQYDSDGNRWIDRNDAVYDRLRVWSPAAGDGLASLAGRGVGALYLGSIDTAFSINDAANNPLGLVRASGAYLNENGTAGTLQQIDLMV